MKTKFTLVMTLAVLSITYTNAQWSNVVTNSIKNLYSISIYGNQGLIGGTNGDIIHSTDGGLTWKDSLYYPYETVNTVAYATATLAVAGSTKFYGSTNGGTSFTSPYSVSGFNDFRDIAFKDASNGIAIDNFCRIATTTDGGQSFAATGLNPCGNNSELTDIDFPTATVGYICGHNGKVFKSTDGGASWLPVTAPGGSNVNYTAIQFVDANTGFIAGRSNNGGDTTIFKRTTDGGTTWASVIGGIISAGVLPTTPIPSFSFLNANTGYLVAFNKIYKTTNGGTTWSLDFTGNVSFNKILTSANFSLAVGGSGAAARLAGTGTGISEINAVQQISVYPNPTSNTITIGTFLIKNESAFLTITDVKGSIVKAEKIYTNEVDVASFSNGIYFGKLINSDGSNYTFKFVKQ